RRFAVPKMKLQRLTLLDSLSDRNGAELLIGPDQVPNKKISTLEPVAVLVNCDADVQRTIRISPLRAFQRLKDILKALKGRLAAQFIDQILLGSCHDEPFSDRTASLRDDGPHCYWDGEPDSDESSSEQIFIYQQPVLIGSMTASDKPTNGL